jgi:hypothetical protein
VRKPSATIVVPLTLGLLATIAFACALVVRPNDRGPALDAYLLFLGGLGLAALVNATSRAFPRSTRTKLGSGGERRPRAEPIAELRHLERTVDMATQSAFDTYYRLRPTLREIASARLAPLGVELDAQGAGTRAEQLVGEEAWRIVGPQVDRPSDHFAPGSTLAEIEAAVSALEELP